MRLDRLLKRGLLLTCCLLIGTFTLGLGALINGASAPTDLKATLDKAPSQSVALTENSTASQPHIKHTPNVTSRAQTTQQADQATGVHQQAANTDQLQLKHLPKIAIIIDDIGHQWQSGQRTANLHGPVTLAILPFSPYAKQLATLAHQYNKEVMLHAPMEPKHHHAWSGGLTHQMTEVQVQQSLTQMLADVPYVKGVNNHMGSALTSNLQAMHWVMQTLANNNLYFIDSRTTAQSKALEAARASHIPAAKRDIFLDNLREVEAIERQFSLLIKRAHSTGSAIGIGHPYPETLSVLEQQLQNLGAFQVELVPASMLTPKHFTPPLDATTTALTAKMGPQSESNLSL